MKHNFFQIFLLYISIALLFIISGFLILSYSLGYRYDFQKKQVVETGIIRLGPLEKNCSIQLDHNTVKLKKNQQTVEITNLLPDNYTVDISCPQYQNWNKIIEVQAGKIHNENNIFLLPVNPSFTEIAYIQQANTETGNIAYINAENIYVISKESKQPQSYSKIKITSQSQIKWINDINIVILEQNNNQTSLQILNTYNGNSTNLTLNYLLTPDQIIGQDNFGGENLYFFYEQNLYKINTNHNPENKPTIFLENIFNPKIYNNYLFYQTAQNSKEIISLNLTFKYSSTIHVEQPVFAYFLIPQKNLLVYQSEDKFFIFNINNNINKSLDSTIDTYSISPDQQNIVFGNKHEIILTDNNLNTKTLLRLGSEIHSFSWYNNANILYSTGNSIKNIDIFGNNNQTLIENENLTYQIISSHPDKILTIEKRSDSDLLKYINLNQQSG